MHDTESLVSEAILCLREAHSGGVNVLRKYQPWNLLLATKWILQESDESAYLRLPGSRNEIHRLLNYLHEMDEIGPLPSEYPNVHLFMRQLAFQQFWLQHEVDGAAIARQDLLFSSLPPNHTFQRKFREISGVGIAEFLELSFAMVALILSGPKNIAFKGENFSKFAPALSKGAVGQFLACLSKSPPEFYTWLTTAPIAGMSLEDERKLRSPFLDFPLLPTGGTYLPIFIPLLQRSLEGAVYRMLRSADRSDFVMRFGHIFERHVRACLEDANVRFWDETAMRQLFGEKPKCVDFMLLEDDCTVLIEAKAVEMSAKGRVTHRAEVVLGSLRDSALKGVEQGQATMRELRQLTASAPFTAGRKAAFLIVVTFEDLYLGSGSTFDAIYGHVVRPNLESEFGKDLPIPLEHVFFLSIDEFERLLIRVRLGQFSTVEALRFARDQDADGRSRKFIFGQHLNAFGPQEERLPLLQTGLENLAARCRARLS